jgi:hypothetical protein
MWTFVFACVRDAKGCFAATSAFMTSFISRTLKLAAAGQKDRPRRGFASQRSLPSLEMVREENGKLRTRQI